MLQITGNVQMLDARRVLYATLLNMKPRVFSNKETIKVSRKEKVRELPKLNIDKQRIKSHVQTQLQADFPQLEPLFKMVVKVKEVTKPPVVTSAPVKKDTFIQAQEAFFGYGRPENRKEALELYLDAERRGIYQASICLGKMYMKGEGVSKDHEKALAHFKKAASSQNTDSNVRGDGLYWIGYLHMHNYVGTASRIENLKIAVENLEKAASQCKHSDAMTDLGILADQGLLAQQDLKKARKLYTEAADLGNPRAMDNLGVLLLRLESNPDLDPNRTNENYQKYAYERFKAAQEQGYKKSMTNLGIMYLHGLYVEKDLVNAKALFKLAASGDHPDIEAKYYLAYFGLKEASMSQDEKKFEKVSDELRYVLAMNPDHSDAHYYLAFLYENGLGTDKDMRVALKHYQRAMESDSNNTKAKCKVADFFMTGEGQSYPDRTKAFELYKEAASRGNSDALLALGTFYETGTQVPKDPALAKNYYQQAAELGNPSALFNLGMAIHTTEPAKSNQRVVELMKQAAYSGNDRAKDFLSKFTSQMQTQTMANDVGTLNRGVLDQNSLNVKYDSKFF